MTSQFNKVKDLKETSFVQNQRSNTNGPASLTTTPITQPIAINLNPSASIQINESTHDRIFGNMTSVPARQRSISNSLSSLRGKESPLSKRGYLESSQGSTDRSGNKPEDLHLRDSDYIEKRSTKSPKHSPNQSPQSSSLLLSRLADMEKDESDTRNTALTERLKSLRIARSSSLATASYDLRAPKNESKSFTTDSMSPKFSSPSSFDGRLKSPNMTIDQTDFTITRQGKEKKLYDKVAKERTISKRLALMGLRNLGNTCFMNSCLQCLCHTSVFSQHFLNSLSLDINEKSPHGGSLASAFGSVIQNLHTNEDLKAYAPYSPSNFRSVIYRIFPFFKDRGQHDSHEFLRMLLQGLHEDCNTVVNPQYKEMKDINGESECSKSERAWNNYIAHTSSIVTDTFGGQLQSSVRCSRCRTVSTAYDVIWDLSLQIQSQDNHSRKEASAVRTKEKRRNSIGGSSQRSVNSEVSTSLYECLDSFSMEEVLNDAEAYYCTKCKIHSKATKSLRICKFPKVLVIQLKRFSSSRGLYSRQKLGTPIEFPLEGLDLQSYLSDDHLDVDVPLYDCICVSNHFGSMSGGHYTAYCKVNDSEGNWYNFDDGSVQKLGNYESKDNISSVIVTESAYLLFYVARGTE